MLKIQDVIKSKENEPMKKIYDIRIKFLTTLFCSMMVLLLCSMPVSAWTQDGINYITGPVSDQVGMYSYRVNDLVEYTKSDPQGQVVKRISIQRDEHGNVVGKTHYNQNNDLCIEDFIPI